MKNVIAEAQAYHSEFRRLFSNADASTGERPAPAVVYYFKMRIFDLLGLEPDENMEYDMADDRFIQEDDEDEDDDGKKDHGEYDYLDTSEMGDWWKSL